MTSDTDDLWEDADDDHIKYSLNKDSSSLDKDQGELSDAFTVASDREARRRVPQNTVNISDCLLSNSSSDDDINDELEPEVDSTNLLQYKHTCRLVIIII